MPNTFISCILVELNSELFQPNFTLLYVGEKRGQQWEPILQGVARRAD